MMETDRIDDALLSAWLDGELDSDERARVDAWLRDHPDDAARVRMWAADRDALRARFDPVLDEPVPAEMVRALSRPARFPPWARAAAVAGVFVAGALVGGFAVDRWTRGPTGTPMAGAAWVQRAAVAHSVYVPEKRHPVEVRASEEHLARWLTRRTDIPVRLFDLRAHGFELVGGRLLPDDASPSAQLMYENTAGERVTVYLRKPDRKTPAAFRYEQQGELGLFYWVEDECGYALVGALPRERLLALAEAIYQQDKRN